MTTLTISDDPKAWVGCLACYNAGNLKGDWVDGLEAGDFVPCNTPGHEEWWVMDHECLPVIKGECSPSEFQKASEWWNEIVAEVGDVDAVAAWVSAIEGDWSDKTANSFYEAYSGEHDSPKDFAQCFADDVCDPLPKEYDRWPYNCIDWDYATRQLMYDYTEVRGKYVSYFFRSSEL